MPAHRRLSLGVATIGAAALTLPLAAPAGADVVAPDPLELTLVATTDLHGHVRDWDYFRNAPFPATDSLGVARASTAINEIREARVRTPSSSSTTGTRSRARL
ncbi:hypothetical protein [Litorihabitans aurantiacus]|nr:hypothetical protein [Litorihabitans aurantiacus]